MPETAFKKRKVLFVYPDFVENKAATQLKGSYSEGIASISAVLKQGGHDVALYHMGGMVTREEYIRELKSHRPDIVAFSTWTSAYRFVKDLLTWTKEETDAFTLVGGYHATLCPQEIIEHPAVDCVCIGEGEYPTLDVCNRLDDREALHKTESLWFRVDGAVIKNPVRPFIEDLSSLPMPDLDLFNFDEFLSSKIKTAIVMVSRGCIFSCTYCANSQLREVYPHAKKYARFKDPRQAIAYLKLILEKYPYFEYFNFMDSILNMRKEWFDQFIELYAEELSHIPFACRLRLDLLDEDVVRRLKKANCYLVDVGIESGDEKLRSEILWRKMSDETILKAFTWFRKYKISTLCFNIVGLPFEDLKKSLKTIKLNARIKPNKMVVSIFFPFPSTRLTDMARAEGFLTDDSDFTKEVVIKQPQYPAAQVMFAQQYFKIYVRLYKLAFACPKPLRFVFEKLFDFMFTFKYKPHMLFVWIHRAYVKAFHGLKRLLMRLSPRLYVRLRDWSVKLKKNDVKKTKKNEAGC